VNIGRARSVLSKEILVRHVLVYFLAYIATVVVVVYTSYNLLREVYLGYSATTPPLDMLPRDVIASLPYLGPVTLGGIIALALKAGGLLLFLSIIYNTLKASSFDRVITSLYFLMMIAIGTGNLTLEDTYRLIWSTLIILYLYTMNRGWLITVKTLRDKGTGRLSRLRVSSRLLVNSVMIPVSYLLPIAIALGSSAIVVSITEYIRTSDISFPPPISTIWMVFSYTRLAILLVAISVILVLSLVFREIADGILLLLFITPKEGKDRVIDEVRREAWGLASNRVWHLSIPVNLFTLIAMMLSYVIVYSMMPAIEEIVPGFKSLPWYLGVAVSFSVSLLVWGVVRREVRRMLAMKGESGLSVKSLLLLMFLLLFIVIGWIQGRWGIESIYQALGIAPPSSQGDVLSQLGLWPHNLYTRLQDFFINLEEKARTVVVFLWG